jgi:mannose-6-phosphate isomerase-like protein (cupin superfamily)
VKELVVDIFPIKIDHEDHRRIFKTIFNGDFVAKQAIVYEVKEDSVVGRHFHDYGEIWCVLVGKMDYLFRNVDTLEEKRFSLTAGQAVRIPKRTFHEAKVYKGSTLLGFTEEKFISNEVNNHI